MWGQSMPSRLSSKPKPRQAFEGDRYPEYWSRLSVTCKRLTGYRCCYPGCNSSRANGDEIETHHIVYGRVVNSKWTPYREYIPGLMLVPLCERHHQHRHDPECAHHPANWFAGTKKNQFRDARNTEAYHLKLVQGWHEKLLPQYRQH